MKAFCQTGVQVLSCAASLPPIHKHLIEVRQNLGPASSCFPRTKTGVRCLSSEDAVFGEQMGPEVVPQRRTNIEIKANNPS